MGFKPYSLVKEWFLKRTIKIKHYPGLDDQEKFFVDYTIKNSLKANSILRVGRAKRGPKESDFWQLSWNDIILLRMHLGDTDLKAILELMYRVSDKEFANLNLLNASAVYKYVAECIDAINRIEKEQLDDEPSSEEKDAGVDQLNDFDYSVSLDVLAAGDILKYDELLAKPYSVIFRKLCLNKVKGEIQRNYNEIVSRKAKTGVR